MSCGCLGFDAVGGLVLCVDFGFSVGGFGLFLGLLLFLMFDVCVFCGLVLFVMGGFDTWRLSVYCCAMFTSFADGFGDSRLACFAYFLLHVWFEWSLGGLFCGFGLGFG